jgi:hypothetical protein
VVTMILPVPAAGRPDAVAAPPSDATA